MRILKCTLLAALLLFPALGFGNGKMYARFVAENTPSPGVPYQRALLVHAEESQLLILQSQYHLPEDAPTEEVGWVVPVPEVPVFSDFTAFEANNLFSHLHRQTMPEVISIRVLLFGSWVLLGSPAIVLLVLFRKRIVRASQQKPAWWNVRAQSLIPMLAWIHFFLLVMSAIFIPAVTRSLGNGGIEILHREQVGVYDVHVISADTPEPMLEWLREHDFAFSPDDAAVFQAYLDSGWVFVAARLKPPADTLEPFIHMRGFAAPLVMHFPTETPVYPMALTGTVGESTEVLLYLITETPVKDHSNIPLQFAGESFPIRRLPSFPETAQPWPHPGYLYQFHGKLASEDMREDFFFHSAESFKPKGRHIVRW